MALVPVMGGGFERNNRCMGTWSPFSGEFEDLFESSLRAPPWCVHHLLKVLNTIELNFRNTENETLTNTTLPLTSSECMSVGFEALPALPPLSLFGSGYTNIEWSWATRLHR